MQHRYFQSDTSLLADVSNNFRDMSLELHELDPERFLSLTGLAWKTDLKKAKVKLDLLTDIDMLSNGRKKY